MLAFTSSCFATIHGPESNKVSSDGLVEISNMTNAISGVSKAGYITKGQRYFLDDGEFERSGALSISNDGMVICGGVSKLIPESSFIDYSRGVMWKYSLSENRYNMKILDIPVEYINSRSQNMSDDGNYIVGSVSVSRDELYNSSIATEQASYWDQNGNIHLLGSISPDYYSSIAYDVSNTGIIVGTEISFGSAGQNAIIWDEQNGIRNLRDVLIDEYGYDFEGCILSEAWYINPEGTYISGSGYDASGNNMLWEATIPEPASLMLFGLGCLLLRKRKMAYSGL